MNVYEMSEAVENKKGDESEKGEKVNDSGKNSGKAKPTLETMGPIQSLSISSDGSLLTALSRNVFFSICYYYIYIMIRACLLYGPFIRVVFKRKRKNYYLPRTMTEHI